MKKRILSSFLIAGTGIIADACERAGGGGTAECGSAVVTEEPGEVHGEPPVEEAAGPEEPACICESLCTGGDREHGLPHLHGGLYRLYL